MTFSSRAQYACWNETLCGLKKHLVTELDFQARYRQYRLGIQATHQGIQSPINISSSTEMKQTYQSSE